MKYDEFFKELELDKEKKEKFAKAIESTKAESPEEAWNKASEFAKELGYDVDPSEFAIASRMANEISDEELEGLSAGISGSTPHNCSGEYMHEGKDKCFFNYVCEGLWNVCYISDECSHSLHCGGNISCTRNSNSCALLF